MKISHEAANARKVRCLEGYSNEWTFFNQFSTTNLPFDEPARSMVKVAHVKTNNVKSTGFFIHNEIGENEKFVKRARVEAWGKISSRLCCAFSFHFKISSWIMKRISKSQNSTIRPFIVPLKSQRSFIPTRPTTRARSSNTEVFYTLAASEESSIKFDKGAMKQVASSDKIKSKSDKTGYLQTRYSERPPSKYNFPEATSMRYGWIN